MSFSPLPQQSDAIFRRQAHALTVSRLGERLLKKAASALEEELKCGWIPVSVRPGKRPSRIAQKIERIFQRAEESGTTTTFDEALSKVKDLAGGRFLIPYLGDVGRAHQAFCASIKMNRRVRLDGDAEDYNTSPRASGYRGLHQGLIVKINRSLWFPFEVQFLTFLQADWASKEHLVYENPEKYPESVRQQLKELSDTLHNASESFDRLRDIIAGIE